MDTGHTGLADAECIVVVVVVDDDDDDDDAAVVAGNDVAVAADDAGDIIAVVVGECNYGYFHCAAGSSLAVASSEATGCVTAATRYMMMGVG